MELRPIVKPGAQQTALRPIVRAQPPQPAPVQVGVGDVVREIPGAAKKVTSGIVNTFLPAITNFVRTTGSVIGEGLAYAIDPAVRKAYEGGDTQVLPTITDTTPGDIAKYTVAAGIEAAVFKSFPDIVKMNLASRGGAGALQGVGFAIAEGMANDKSADEILDNATKYGASGAAIAAVAPYLVPLLQKEIKISGGTKKLFQNLEKEVPKGKVPESENYRFNKALKNQGYEPTQPTRAQRVSAAVENSLEKDTTGQRTESLDFLRKNPNEVAKGEVRVKELEGKMFIEDGRHRLQVAKELGIEPNIVDVTDAYTGKKSARVEELIGKKIEVPQTQLPVGKGAEKVSQLEKRMRGISEQLKPEDAKKLGISTYKQSNQVEQIQKAAAFVKKDPDAALSVLRGERAAPDGILDNAILVALSQTDDAQRTALAAKLSTLKSTRYGQEISILQKVDPDNPVVAMQDIIVARSKAVERRLGTKAKEMLKSTTKSAKAEMTKAELKLEDAQKLLDDLLC